jgi:hypothetical protein
MDCFEQKAVDVETVSPVFVLKIDTTKLQRAHFAAKASSTTTVESPSSFELDLSEGATTLESGWDVCFGESSPSCFTNLEMNPGIGTRTVSLTVRRKAGASAKTADVRVCVFDPLE